MGKWVTAVEVTLRGQSLSALRHLSHFLTCCAEHEHRRLLARYLSHLIINIMWSLDNMTARHYLQLVVSHLHVVQLRDPFLGNSNQNHFHIHQRQADSLSLNRSQGFSEDKVVAWKPTECSSNKILNYFLSKCNWWCCCQLKKIQNLNLTH